MGELRGLPREATEAAARALYSENFSLRWRPIALPYDRLQSDAPTIRELNELATATIAAALPFLRAQWEADLLSDKAIERAAIELEEGFTGLPAGTVIAAGDEQWHTAARWHAEAILRAALGSCVRSEGETP